MKAFWFLPALSLLLAKPIAAQESLLAQNVNNISDKLREKCLAATDFAGCVRAYTQKGSGEKDVDFLGKPVIKGWRKITDQTNDQIWYLDPEVSAINVRGTYGRYIGFGVVSRWFQQAIAGRAATSPTTVTLSGPQTNCYGYGYNVSCTTTPARTITMPGRAGTAATPEGIKQKEGYIVIDCLEVTQKAYNFSGGWTDVLVDFADILDDNCHRISSLPKVTYSDLAKGKPNSQDRKAIETLPRRKETNTTLPSNKRNIRIQQKNEVNNSIEYERSPESKSEEERVKNVIRELKRNGGLN